MEGLIDYLVSLNIPYVDQGVARLIGHVILAAIVAVAAPGSLMILTWLERKIIARIQNRIGPNRAGPYGLFQAVADMVKMFTKEDVVPQNADLLPFNIAPGLAVIGAIMSFAVVPFAPSFVGADLNMGLLYIVAIGGLGTIAVLMGGWASNNKYSLLGAFRVVAMMLTYEIPLVITLITVAIVAGSMSLQDIVIAQAGMWYIVTMPLAFILFFFSGLAETGRSPFDLIEAESEIIAGFHTEYSGIKFGLFMIGEYVHMFVLSFFCSVLFLGGWQLVPFVNLATFPTPWNNIIGVVALLIKVFLFVFIMMWFRGTLPRFRIDHLLDLGWKFLVPISIALMIGVAIVTKLFSPPSSAYPGPLGGMGMISQVGEVIALLLVNLGIAAIAIWIVHRNARHSRNKTLRSVSAVEKPVPKEKTEFEGGNLSLQTLVK